MRSFRVLLGGWFQRLKKHFRCTRIETSDVDLLIRTCDHLCYRYHLRQATFGLWARRATLWWKRVFKFSKLFGFKLLCCPQLFYQRNKRLVRSTIRSALRLPSLKSSPGYYWDGEAYEAFDIPYPRKIRFQSLGLLMIWYPCTLHGKVTKHEQFHIQGIMYCTNQRLTNLQDLGESNPDKRFIRVINSVWNQEVLTTAKAP